MLLETTLFVEAASAAVEFTHDVGSRAVVLHVQVQLRRREVPLLALLVRTAAKDNAHSSLEQKPSTDRENICKTPFAVRLMSSNVGLCRGTAGQFSGLFEPLSQIQARQHTVPRNLALCDIP